MEELVMQVVVPIITAATQVLLQHWLKNNKTPRS
jgi:hypothetical protein